MRSPPTYRRLLRKVPQQDEMLTLLMKPHIKFRYDICPGLVIIAVYMNVLIFNDTGKIIQSAEGGGVEELMCGHQCINNFVGIYME
jgi:hypothetical protein